MKRKAKALSDDQRKTKITKLNLQDTWNDSNKSLLSYDHTQKLADKIILRRSSGNTITTVIEKIPVLRLLGYSLNDFYDDVIDAMGLHHISSYMFPHAKSKPLYQSYFAKLDQILINFSDGKITTISKGVPTKHRLKPLHKKLVNLVRKIKIKHPQWFKGGTNAFDDALYTTFCVNDGSKAIARNHTVSNIEKWTAGGTWMNLSSIEFIDLVSMRHPSHSTLIENLNEI